ncbi:natterin-4-like [Anoplophora glabripennis]|uniref:natterin-4-like n=1 Tax=Anoplophora glabripennis TaxID=217634 RepID=UPI000C76F623|nr:natterin-4-like [Anoplophora glabripennis]
MAEYGFKPEILPSAPQESSEHFSCPQPQPTYPRGVPCSLSCCNPTNGFKPPFYHVLPPGYSPHIQYSAFRPIHPIDESSVKAYYWVDTHAWGGIPSTALHGGVDIDGEQIYVGRAYHNGDWLPAKVIPGRNIAYVSYEGEEYHKDSFQVLCEQRFDWIPNHGGYIPPGAIEGGRTSDGEILYIGRVQHEGTQTVGKVHPSHGVCYIPFDGKELSFEDYEILILRR